MRSTNRNAIMELITGGVLNDKYKEILDCELVYIENLEEENAELKKHKVPGKPIGRCEISVCPECHLQVKRPFPYCPHCGQKLDWVKRK